MALQSASCVCWAYLLERVLEIAESNGRHFGRCDSVDVAALQAATDRAHCSFTAQRIHIGTRET